MDGSITSRRHQPFTPPITGIVTPTPSTYGTARFLEAGEMLQKGFLTQPKDVEARPPLGYIADQRLGTPRLTPVYGEMIHNLYIGPTGAGKSTQFLATTALTHAFGILVNDPKGEIYTIASGARLHFLGRRQILLSCDTETPEETDFINPLETIRIDRSNPKGGMYEVRDCKVLVELMAEEASEGDNRTWEVWSKERIVGTILHMLTAELSPLQVADDGSPEDALVRSRSFEELERLLTLQTPAARALAKNMTASRREAVRSSGRALLASLQGDGKMYEGIKGFARALVEPWRDPLVRQMTYRSLEDRPGSEPAPSSASFADLRDNADIYIVSPPMDLGLFKSVLRTMTGLAVDVLARTKMLPGTPPVQFLLDEFPQLGRMAPMENWLLFTRGYGILFNYFVQDLGVLRSLYPERWSSFETSCNKIYFAVADADTAEHVGRHLGQTTVRDESHAFTASQSRGTTKTVGGFDSTSSGTNSSSGPQGGSSGSSFNSSSGKNWSDAVSQTVSNGLSDTVGYVGRSLMTVDEIMTLGKHEAIVFVRGHRPMKLLRVPFWMFRDLKERSEIEAPRRLRFVDFMRRI